MEVSGSRNDEDHNAQAAYADVWPAVITALRQLQRIDFERVAAEAQRALIRMRASLGRAIPQLGAAIVAWQAQIPPNWQGLTWGEAVRTGELMASTGWCLAWVPRVDTVRFLLESDDREVALLVCADTILEDVAAALDEVVAPDLMDLASFASIALGAHECGHHEAAQALTASVLTAAIHSLTPATLTDARTHFSQDREHRPVFRYREAVIFAALSWALEPYYPQRGDPVPSAFNRHAVAHGVSRHQFTELNSLVGLLAIAALLRNLQELHPRQAD